MKKVLLFSLILLGIILPTMAYETIIIDYPKNENWIKVFYKKYPTEALLQFVPQGQSSQNWQRAIFLHSYGNNSNSADTFSSTNIARMTRQNPTGQYRYLTYSKNDSIAFRCTNDYKNVSGQCEFYRTTNAHGGIITLHYVNKNKQEFMDNYMQWFNIIKNARYYNSYYRTDRILDKSEFYELF